HSRDRTEEPWVAVARQESSTSVILAVEPDHALILVELVPSALLASPYDVDHGRIRVRSDKYVNRIAISAARADNLAVVEAHALLPSAPTAHAARRVLDRDRQTAPRDARLVVAARLGLLARRLAGAPTLVAVVQLNRRRRPRRALKHRMRLHKHHHGDFFSRSSRSHAPNAGSSPGRSWTAGNHRPRQCGCAVPAGIHHISCGSRAISVRPTRLRGAADRPILVLPGQTIVSPSLFGAS